VPTFAVWWLSCAEAPDPTGTPSVTTPTDLTPTTETTDPTGTTPSETSPTADLCPPDAAVTVVAAEALPGRLKNQRVIEVTTSVEAAVGIQCTSVADPTDIHLLEDAGGTTEHVFDLGGLLVDDHYDCLAAAICPRSYDDPVAFGFDVDPSPSELVPVTVEINPVLGMTGAYTMFNLEVCGGDWDWIHLVDPEGRTRWWHAIEPAPNMGLEVRHQGDGIITWGGGYTSVGRPRRVDVFDGEIYDSAVALADYGSTIFHHDGKELEDGRIMTLETETTNYEGSSFEGFAVRLHDPVTETVSWEYTSQTAVDAGELSAGTAVGDVWHANWADVVVEGGVDKLYLSLCYYYQVLKIDPVSGSIEWTFGPGGDFALQDLNGNPLPDVEFSSCQHGLEVSGNRLLIYDNGWSRYESRIAEYELDTTTMTATLLWTWTDGWYICCLGDADYLDNGRVLLEQASFGCGGNGTKVIEIDPATGQVASKIFLRPSDASYRAERLDGCELFDNAAYCPDVATRVTELAPVFTLDSP
jgi:Arylsulfotransferase (ASST)